MPPRAFCVNDANKGELYKGAIRGLYEENWNLHNRVSNLEFTIN